MGALQQKKPQKKLQKNQQLDPSIVKVFNCKSCGAGLVIRARGYSMSIACGSCGAVADTSDENYRVLHKAQQAKKHEPLIPLGKRGKLNGVQWEAIGFMLRSDVSSFFQWHEYLLFNPYKGFRWLTMANGHWNYVVTTKSQAKTEEFLGKKKAHLFGKDYKIFHAGFAKVDYVLGEFYWRVKVGTVTEVEDYIAPPEMLSYEKEEDEIHWSLAQWIAPQTVRSAFKILGSFPEPKGIAPNQPAITHSLQKPIRNIWLGVCVILMLIQFFFVLNAKNEQAFIQSYELSPAQQPPQQLITEPFQLNGETKNIALTLHAPVSNSFLEVEGNLINNATGKSFDFQHGVEYWYGRDSDGDWKEGSHTNTIYLSSIPEGTYYLSFKASYSQPAPITYNLSVRRDVPVWSDLILFFILASLFPLGFTLYHHAAESRRWADSDFSIYPDYDGEFDDDAL